jgi:hypothetical protein|tara:strand:+ start:1633 stop:1923 length:291 start_codon:yes stop_codon:yes gene_type:complete
MQTDKFEISIGDLGVQTTQNRGHTVEEIAEMATNKLISISDTADPMVKAQAHAFRDKCKMVITFYVQEGIKNHICTVCNQLEQQGHKDLANIIRRL